MIPPNPYRHDLEEETRPVYINVSREHRDKGDGELSYSEEIYLWGEGDAVQRARRELGIQAVGADLGPLLVWPSEEGLGCLVMVLMGVVAVLTLCYLVELRILLCLPVTCQTLSVLLPQIQLQRIQSHYSTLASPPHQYTGHLLVPITLTHLQICPPTGVLKTHPPPAFSKSNNAKCCINKCV